MTRQYCKTFGAPRNLFNFGKWEVGIEILEFLYDGLDLTGPFQVYLRP